MDGRATIYVESREERDARLAREDAPPRAYGASTSVLPVRCPLPCGEYNLATRDRCRVCGLPLHRPEAA